GIDEARRPIVGVEVFGGSLEVGVRRPRLVGVFDDGRAIGGRGGAVTPPVIGEDRPLGRRAGPEAYGAAGRPRAGAIDALADQDPVHAVVAVPEVLGARLVRAGRVMREDLGAVARFIVGVLGGVSESVEILDAPHRIVGGDGVLGEEPPIGGGLPVDAPGLIVLVGGGAVDGLIVELDQVIGAVVGVGLIHPGKRVRGIRGVCARLGKQDPGDQVSRRILPIVIAVDRPRHVHVALQVSPVVIAPGHLVLIGVGLAYLLVLDVVAVESLRGDVVRVRRGDRLDDVAVQVVEGLGEVPLPIGAGDAPARLVVLVLGEDDVQVGLVLEGREVAGEAAVGLAARGEGALRQLLRGGDEAPGLIVGVTGVVG